MDLRLGGEIKQALRAYVLRLRLDRPAMPIEGPCILAIWHGRLFLVPLLKHGPKPLIALISSHRDGQLISKAAATYGVETAMGSTTRGGMRAARELIRFARAGHSLLMTPDGPRGPRMQASEGILDLARLTGLPILPVSLSASRMSSICAFIGTSLVRP